ncbi:hypothetical protein V6N12_016749 [Hibiscus sabdariffa]|uniref:Uncharacterized protein n=1 Tax=Hibiscus sabdariffa TaxID=183260 RepID=A0ABR2CGM1_9ROSI
MKSPPNEGDELMEMNNKPGLETKKNPCICSPTSHAGSFRCHLHRATGTAASKPQEPSLSRFGRAGSNLKLKPISDSSLRVTRHYVIPSYMVMEYGCFLSPWDWACVVPMETLESGFSLMQ